MKDINLGLIGLMMLAKSLAYEPQDIYSEPNCAIVKDYSRKFRDISDPTHYWMCPDGAEKAVDIRCPTDTAFMETLQKCVPWVEWKWLEPYSK